MDWGSIIGSILGSVSTILVAWFGYNQYTKNKETDAKIERIKEEDKIRGRRRNDNSAKIYGELWTCLHALHADRAYIVQPHPLGDNDYMTIYFEVKEKGIEPMKPNIQKRRMSDVASFAAILERNSFRVINDIESEVEDSYAKYLFCAGGTKRAIIGRLSDNKYDWVGSIIIEFCHNQTIEEEEARHVMSCAATNIQYILPEIEEI